MDDLPRNHVISAPVVKIATGSIALGVAVMILTVSIVTGFKSEVRSRAIGFAGHVVVSAYSNNNSYEQEPIATNAEFLNTLGKNPGIKHIQFFATKNAIIKTAFENQGIIIKGVDRKYDWSFIKQYLLEGNTLKLNDSLTSDQILVSQTIANKLGIKAGDKLVTYFVGKKTIGDSANSRQYEYRVRKFTVNGIYQTGFSDVDDNVVFADLKQIQKLNYWNTGQAGGIEIELNDLEKLDELTEQIDGDIGQGLEARSVRSLYPTLFSWLELLDSNAAIVITLMIIVAIMNMISALLILILERSNTIGILKALGAGNMLVQKVFLYQSARMLGNGLLIGNIVGVLLTYLELRFKLVGLDPQTYYVSFIPAELHLTHFLALNALTVVSCLFMMLLPVLAISKITPVRSLRFK